MPNAAPEQRARTSGVLLKASSTDVEPLEQRFTFERLVGRGAFGEVWRGCACDSGAPVAIKRLVSDADDPSAAQRLAREGRLLGRVESPYIVRRIATGRDSGGRPCVVLEWLDGEDLRKRLRRGPLGPDEALEIAQQVARGLDALHEAGVVHRDVKPSNVFLLDRPEGDLVVKLLDLGTAYGVGEPGLTIEGFTLGTPAYMSPEQARGVRALSARSDVYSLGVVLFELLAGRRPFQGTDGLSELARVVLGDAPELTPLARDLHPLLARLFAKEPEARMDASELATELGRICAARRGGQARKVTDAGRYSQIQTRRADASGSRERAADSERQALSALGRAARGTAAWFEAVSACIRRSASRGQYDDAETWLQAASAFAAADEHLGAQTRCLAEGVIGLLDGGRRAEPRRVLDLLAARRSVPDRVGAAGRAAEDLARAAASFHEGAVGEAIFAAERAVATLEPLDEPALLTRARILLSRAYAELGAFAFAEGAARVARDSAERRGAAALAAEADDAVLWIHVRSGKLDAARMVPDAAVGTDAAEGSARPAMRSLMFAIAALRTGRPGAAEAHARFAAERLAARPPAQAFALAVLAEALVEQARAAEALAWAHEANALVDSLPGIPEGEALVRLAFAKALEHSGDHAAARRTLARAANRLTDRAVGVPFPALRSSFLSGIVEHAQTLALAVAWGCRPTLA